MLDRTNLAAGPIWEQTLSGPPLKQGDNVSLSCFNNGLLYVSSGRIGNTNAYGSIQAFDALTGTPIWSFTWVEICSAAIGTILFQFATNYRVQGASIILNGVLYTPSADRYIYAFNLPSGMSTH